MEEYADHDSILVAEVDCTAEGKKICDDNGVKGFPTIKHGDMSMLEAYEGGRKLDDLKTFASKLKPVCSPAKRDLCEPDVLAKIEEFEAKTSEEIDELIEAAEGAIEKAEKDFKAGVEKVSTGAFILCNSCVNVC